MRTGALAVGLFLVATPISAQAPGIPIVNAGFARGFTLGSMVGFDNASAGDGTGFVVSGTVGFRRIAVGGFVSGLTGSVLSTETVVAGGATVAIKLAGGPLVPVAITLLTGAGYYSIDRSLTTSWRVPVGLGIAWTIPQPVVALKLWAAPRLDYARVRGPDPPADPVPGGAIPLRTTTGSDFGLSAGVNLGFLNGFGIDLAVDQLFAGEPGSKPTSFGVGASYHFK